MLEELCRELNNYFVQKKYFGVFVIENGEILGDYKLLPDQYFRIVGSALNDGVYRMDEADLEDEIFKGVIWAMAVPPAVLALQKEIEQWTKENEKVLNSPYQSESFGGYSYSLKTGGVDGSITWQSQFKRKLNKWRKICPY